MDGDGDEGRSVLTVADRVRTLIGRYCDRFDAGDWSGVGELFASGRLTAGGAVLAEGAAAVAAFFADGTRLHGGSPRTKHLVLNTQLEEVEGEAGRALVARSSYVVLQAVEGLVALQPIIAGRYVDTFDLVGTAPTPAAPGVDGASGSVSPRWRERAFEVDLVGDLGHHLTWDALG